MEQLKYSVGALLYCPATSEKIIDSIIINKFKGSYSLALCLEDAISANSVEYAENQIKVTFEELYKEFLINKALSLPKIFIRVRNPKQISRVYNSLGKSSALLSGFIFPKYSLDCCDSYNNEILKINSISEKPVFMMPIIESPDLINLNSRSQALYKLKEKLDGISKYILNIRVGGNDFCKEFGIRRGLTQNIYQVLPLTSLLSDIITVFSRDYVISAPVFEYFSSKNDIWKETFKCELELDKLNGFVGKTVIHPNQIPIVNETLKVDYNDYKDAIDILSWSEKSTLLVGKSDDGNRMNEVKTHIKWAQKIINLANVYGVKND